MIYINVGAFVSGERPRTKKALREALRDTPDAVIFDRTLIPGRHLPPEFRGNYLPVTGTHRIPTGVTLSVVGPDPYRVRKWYASVTVDSGGRIRIA
jgi:hypothetical protein